MDAEAVYIAIIVLAVLKFILAVTFAVFVIQWLKDDEKRSCSIVAGFVHFFYFLGINT